jgi:hypothetical protein
VKGGNKHSAEYILNAFFDILKLCFPHDAGVHSLHTRINILVTLNLCVLYLTPTAEMDAKLCNAHKYKEY